MSDKSIKVLKFDVSGTSVLAVNPSIERHFSIQEIAALWGVSAPTVREIFRGRAGVKDFGTGARQKWRIPESLLLAVQAERMAA